MEAWGRSGIELLGAFALSWWLGLKGYLRT